MLVLTDRRAAASAGRGLAGLVAALAGLPVAIVFREKDLPAGERALLGAEVARVAERAGLPLIVASDAGLARTLGAVGVHLAAADPVPAGWDRWLGRSCHDAGELARATAEEIDHVTLSPVFESPGKPGYGPPLGLDTFAALVATTHLPVYALAGVTPASVGACIDAGARGVAVQGAVMAASDPVSVARSLVEAVAAVRTIRTIRAEEAPP